jgi:Na+/H+-dicarboxylate symporter
MAEIRQNRPSLLLDLLIVAVGAALLFATWRLGLEVGRPLVKGVAAVVLSLYFIYIGVLFLLSYFFSDACYVFIFMRYVCEELSRPAGRGMAFFYFVLSLLAGGGVLLFGLGVL